MSALATAQQALLDALLAADADHTPWESIGLGVYRANAHAHAERTLADTHPVVRALIGDGSFNQLARALWHRHPPVRGDLGEWGEALADFIAREPAFDALPYLSDVAQLEWAMHRAGRAPHIVSSAQTFALLQTTAPDQLFPLLAAGTQVLVSDWPILSILDAHLHGEPGFDTVAQRVRDRAGECVRVWRPDAQVRAAVIEREQARFEALLAAGHSLGHALEHAPIDIQPWLENAVRDARLLGFQAPDSPMNTTGDRT